ILGLTLIIVMGTGQADAQGPRDYARTGPFLSLGLNLGSANYAWMKQLDQAAAEAARTTLSNPGFVGTVRTGYSPTTFLGVGFSGGYRLAPRWALDFSLDWARSDLWADVVVATDSQRVGTRRKVGGIETGIASVNARFYALTGRLQPFALAGVGAMMATPVDLSGNKRHAYGFSSKLGAGFDFYVTRHFAATGLVSYDFATGDTERSDLFLFNVYLTWRY
ncbi:porin family protein, partial [Myxococcota bacterium]|nr:porin family protein [Myxococcota bacterium]